jgi:ATP-dependent Clp protease protease subunit
MGFKISEVVETKLSLTLEDSMFLNFLKNGVLFLDNEIDECAFSGFCRDLLYLKLSGLGEGKPIWIILNSPGGDVLHGLGIYDFIKSVTNTGATVNILTMGVTASMATVILQAGSKRYSMPNAQFLVHEISQSILSQNEKVSDGEERVAENVRINKVVMGLIAKRVGVSADELIKTSKKKDCWYDALQARSLGTNGLVDEIIDILPF